MTCLKKKEKLISALWFGGFGLLISSILYFLPSLKKGFWPLVLYIGIALVSSSLAGFLRGDRILNKTFTKNTLQASLIGISISIIAFLLFSPLFAITYYLITDDGYINLLGLIWSIYIIGGLSLGPILLITGGIAGALLFTIREYLS